MVLFIAWSRQRTKRRSIARPKRARLNVGVLSSFGSIRGTNPAGFERAGLTCVWAASIVHHQNSWSKIHMILFWNLSFDHLYREQLRGERWCGLFHFFTQGSKDSEPNSLEASWAHMCLGCFNRIPKHLINSHHNSNSKLFFPSSVSGKI